MSTPHAAIVFNPETGKYGFSVWMPGKHPHYEMLDSFDTPEDAKDWLDPQNERVWKHPGSAAGVVAISHGYKEGSVPKRLQAGVTE